MHQFTSETATFHFNTDTISPPILSQSVRPGWSMLEFQIGAHYMNLSERITMDPEICHGKPTVRGLRYTVESILELLSSGMAVEEILADYEDLEREDILTALDFARQLSQIKRIEPIVA